MFRCAGHGQTLVRSGTKVSRLWQRGAADGIVLLATAVEGGVWMRLQRADIGRQYVDRQRNGETVEAAPPSARATFSAENSHSRSLPSAARKPFSLPQQGTQATFTANAWLFLFVTTMQSSPSSDNLAHRSLNDGKKPDTTSSYPTRRQHPTADIWIKPQTPVQAFSDCGLLSIPTSGSKNVAQKAPWAWGIFRWGMPTE